MSTQPLAPQTFEPFGSILTSDTDRFQVLYQSTGHRDGWQVAINRVVDTQAMTIHRHLNTDECFIPLAEPAVLLVAPAEAPEQITMFNLDMPVRITAGIWHTIISSRPPVDIFICEAAEVTSEVHPLTQPLSC